MFARQIGEEDAFKGAPSIPNPQEWSPGSTLPVEMPSRSQQTYLQGENRFGWKIWGASRCRR